MGDRPRAKEIKRKNTYKLYILNTKSRQRKRHTWFLGHNKQILDCRVESDDCNKLMPPPHLYVLQVPTRCWSTWTTPTRRAALPSTGRSRPGTATWIAFIGSSTAVGSSSSAKRKVTQRTPSCKLLILAEVTERQPRNCRRQDRSGGRWRNVIRAFASVEWSASEN